MRTNILAEVVRKAQEGDHTACKILYEQHAGAMFNICLRMVGDYQLAQDVLQDAFISGFQNLKQLRHPEKFSGWLKKIVIHECIRHTRLRVSTSEFSSDPIETATDDHDDMSSLFDKVNWEHLQNAIVNLPSGYRQVFTLYVIENYSHREIAGMLNISESTSKTQYYYARQSLKKSLLKVMDHG